MVIRTIAANSVIQLVTMPHDRRAAGQGQVLDIRAQTKIHARLDRIDAAIKLFKNLIAPRVDYVEVITSATCHGVIACTAIQGVVTFTA